MKILLTLLFCLFTPICITPETNYVDKDNCYCGSTLPSKYSITSTNGYVAISKSGSIGPTNDTCKLKHLIFTELTKKLNDKH